MEPAELFRIDRPRRPRPRDGSWIEGRRGQRKRRIFPPDPFSPVIVNPLSKREGDEAQRGGEEGEDEGRQSEAMRGEARRDDGGGNPRLPITIF